jgi:hypothetical protein
MSITLASIGCSSCPDYVIQSVSAKSREVLVKIQRLKYLTSIFNRLIKDIANQILGDLQALVDLIPDPPVFNLTEYINLITCPLTPLAAIKDIDIRDPNSPNDPTKINFSYHLNQNLAQSLNPQTFYENNLKPSFLNKKKQVEALYDEALARIGSYDLRELKNEMDLTQRYQNGPGNPSTNPLTNTVIAYTGSYITDGSGNVFYLYQIAGLTPTAPASWSFVTGYGYTNGTYTNVPFSGGTGTGFLANVTVSGTAMSLTSVASTGTAYTVGDILIPVIGAGSPIPSSAVIAVATIKITSNTPGSALQSASVAPGSIILTVNAQNTIIFNDDGAGSFECNTQGAALESMYVNTGPYTYVQYNTNNPATGTVYNYTPFQVQFYSQNNSLSGLQVSVQYKDSSSSPLSIEGAVEKLRNSPQPKSPIAQMVRRYLQELYRALSGNPAQFALDIAFCMAQGAYVQAACPAIYNNPANPFITLANELSSWSFDGLLPSGMDADVHRFMTIIAQAWQKIKKWEDLAYIIV